jgi:hypothetical protein
MVGLHEKQGIVRAIWVLAGGLILFVAENLWIEPWVRAKHAGAPTLIAEAGSAWWFVAFGAGVSVFTAILIGQVILLADKSAPVRSKAGTGAAALLSLLFLAVWVMVTTGNRKIHPFRQEQKHTVTLTWDAPKAKVLGYNIYRKAASGGPVEKINRVVVEGLSYTDTEVESQERYFYVIRAILEEGGESGDSNEAEARIP